MNVRKYVVSTSLESMSQISFCNMLLKLSYGKLTFLCVLFDQLLINACFSFHDIILQLWVHIKVVRRNFKTLYFS